MKLVAPTLPDYDPLEWERLPFAECDRLVCTSRAEQGYGTPLMIFAAYVL